MSLMEKSSDAISCVVYGSSITKLEHRGREIVDVHEPVHRYGQRHIYLIVFVRRIETLTAFGKHSRNREGNVVDRDRAPVGSPVPKRSRATV